VLPSWVPVRPASTLVLATSFSMAYGSSPRRRCPHEVRYRSLRTRCQHRPLRAHARTHPDENAVTEFLEGKQVPYTTWQDWHRRDVHERSLGEPESRERIKVVECADMLRASRRMSIDA
jgi:hypothetical protein